MTISRRIRPRLNVPRWLAVLAAFALMASGVAPVAHAQDTTIAVFAAASLKNAIDDVARAFTKQTGTRVSVSYAASSALMKQIEQGAPADVFLSADLDWMDYGVKTHVIAPDTRLDLLGNRLVLIAPKDSPVTQVALTRGVDLAALAGPGRIATGEVRSVPAGRYAQAALDRLGVWSSVQPKLAMADNVRAALALVTRGEAPLGIVYETDAKIESGVKIVGVFPADSHPPIIYPAALTSSAKPQATAFLTFLRSTTARAVFEAYGFTVLVRSTS